MLRGETCIARTTRKCILAAAFAVFGFVISVPGVHGQTPTRRPAAAPATKSLVRPKLVVLLVLDQMRRDYVDKFLHQWTGGRLPRHAACGRFHRESYSRGTMETIFHP